MTIRIAGLTSTIYLAMTSGAFALCLFNCSPGVSDARKKFEATISSIPGAEVVSFSKINGAEAAVNVYQFQYSATVRFKAGVNTQCLEWLKGSEKFKNPTMAVFGLMSQCNNILQTGGVIAPPGGTQEYKDSMFLHKTDNGWQ
jgi:hypothetical protein